MVHKRLIASMTALAIALPTTAVTSLPARADGSGVVGGLIGGVVGGVIGSQIQRNRDRNRQPQQVIVRERTVVREPVRQRTRIDSYTREQNRTTQVALNYFGFPAGTPDGILGSRSRAAISNYQAYMGYPVTGQLTEYERAFLVSSHQRAIAGGIQTQQLVAQQAAGVQGLLHVYRQQQAAAVAPVVVAQPQPNTTVVVNAQPTGQTAEQAPVEVAAATPEAAAAPGALPMFVTGTAPQASMSSFCARTNVTTTANGGLMQAASLAESEFALAEQFCLIRAFALDEGDRIAATVQGVTREQIQAQCRQFAPTMAQYVGELAIKDADEVASNLQSWAIGTGMNLQALAANARICLGVGYSVDDPDVALAAAMVLVGIGEGAYGEALAHHLALGFGLSENAPRAARWYDRAAREIQGGATSIVAIEGLDRPTLLQAAAQRLRGEAVTAGGQAAPVPALAEQPASQGGFVMPLAPATSN
ncbi:MAG: peptidoglycan-binding domain-containing protein [Pseudomonadota bacterium]